MASLTYISLFAGCGGIDLSLRIACPKARCLGYVEIGIEAAEILAARIEEGSLDDAPVFSDVRAFPAELYRGRVAGIVAGFPCPDYSVAGKRAGITGKHGQLWDDLALAIRDVGPDWVLLENVPGILVPHGGQNGDGTLPAGLWFVLGDLCSLGYDAQWLTLRASAVGASHGRNRWFCLAYRAGGGCGIGRQPSGCNGFADGSHAQLGHAAGDDERRNTMPGAHGEGFASGGPGRSVADAPRDERNGSHGEAGARRGVREAGDELADADGWRCLDSIDGRECGTGNREAQPARNVPDAVADAGDGLLPLAGRRLGGRDGTGPAGAVLADTESDIGRCQQPEGRARIGWPGSAGNGAALGNADLARLEGRRLGEHGTDERSAGQAGNTELADTGCWEQPERGDSEQVSAGWNGAARSADSISGSNCGVADAGCFAEQGNEQPLHGREYEDGKVTQTGSVELADTMRQRRQQNAGSAPCDEETDGRAGWLEREPDSNHQFAGNGTGYRSSELPLFAPGPGATELWQRILREHPELAPAISEEEIESILCRMAPGTSLQLDFEDRTDRLRSLGNLAQSLQAAVAFTVLARRAGLI